ncbi:hypothetical protein [Lactococcus lactis]|uniref:hypothetical protein n=2 Tax=Lactococcus lactis TaxID=1358 RepID=UPI00288DD52C|nr:hypothetical protein [Lactococcus lactis]MDT2859487.1 hypothetical protein [Lactococcus lactis]MDT2862612.1 hypothetical protein [Lactococcus lactis]MDT2871393.1 hypothetical protein [Lactococcus lactis]MDT2877869.1 hypothetical protein [Lactococcus lactis]MDT2892701.1 hypothetical protein [Lactococcus lactis]
MEDKKIPEEQLKILAMKMGEGNQNYKKWSQAILTSNELGYDSDLRRMRRGFIDTSVKSFFQDVQSEFDFVVNERSIGFGHKFFEHTGLTAYGESLVIVKNRFTLINGYEKEKSIHLTDFAKRNTLLLEDESQNLFYQLDKLDGKMIDSVSEGDFAFLVIAYDINPITDNFSHLGIFTLDKENNKVVELQDFSEYIVEPYAMDYGIISPEQTPPPTNNYGLEVRKQSKEDGF